MKNPHMAAPEHLRIIKQGVKAFDEWRKENPKTKPKLVQANLREANLIGADLSEAYLLNSHRQAGGL